VEGGDQDVEGSRDEPNENEDENGGGSEWGGEEQMGPAGNEEAVSGEPEEKEPNGEEYANTAATVVKLREARDRKFRQASRYLVLLVDDIVRQNEESIGGLEIL